MARGKGHNIRLTEKDLAAIERILTRHKFLTGTTEALRYALHRIDEIEGVPLDVDAMSEEDKAALLKRLQDAKPGA